MKKLFLLSALFWGSVSATPFVELNTNKGKILLELDEDNAPATVANFVRYVKADYYVGTVFHRVINGFMIQGGGYDASLQEKPTNAPIANEAHNGLSNARGTIAMARTNNPHSATSQFFINLVDNTFLDQGQNDAYGYAVFGKVIAGMDVVDSIAQVPTGARAPFSQDVPQITIDILSTTLLETLTPEGDTPTETKDNK